MCEERVPEALALTGAFHEAGDIHELDRGRDHHAGLGDPLQDRQPRVGHGDDADVGINGAEGIVGRFRVPGARDGVEQRGLSYVGETDDSGSEHDMSGQQAL